MYVVIILLVIFIILLILNYNKLKKDREKFREDYIYKHKIELQKETDKFREELVSRKNEIEAEVGKEIEMLYTQVKRQRGIVKQAQEDTEEKIALLNKTQQRAVDEYQVLLEERKKCKQKEIDMQLAAEVAHARAEADAKIAQSKAEAENMVAQAQNEATAALDEFLKSIENQKLEAQEKIEQLKEILDDYQEKTKVINEAILRQRAIDEETDFYRICLSDKAIQDIAILNEVRPRLHLHESLDKLIYDVYISKPAQETVKRILGDDIGKGGIYKITRLSTGEIYIGRAASFKDRWIQHIKSAFNVGTIADSLLHRKMREDGVTNYVFEVLEIVPTEKQSEREKYWIEFYDSKTYGLNQRVG